MKKWNRRSFIKKFIFLIFGMEFIYVIYNLLGIKKKEVVVDSFFNAGKLDTFEKGRLYPFSDGKFFLSVFEDGGLMAISVKCTHLGCAVMKNPDGQGFKCPCHASAFNKFGEVMSPPATRALDIFPVVIDKDSVFVDISDPIKRSEFNKAQLVYA